MSCSMGLWGRYHSSQPDFVAIAQKCPYLKPFLIPLGSNRATIDFKSWDATVALTRALLESDYGIVDWNIPQGLFPYRIPPEILPC